MKKKLTMVSNSFRLERKYGLNSFSGSFLFRSKIGYWSFQTCSFSLKSFYSFSIIVFMVYGFSFGGKIED